MIHALLINEARKHFPWEVNYSLTGQRHKLIYKKLPEITFLFWVMKITATTLGETAGDLLSMTLNIGYAVSSVIFISLFLAALCGQFFSKHNQTLPEWQSF